MPSKKPIRSKKTSRGNVFTRFTVSIRSRVKRYHQANSGLSARAAAFAVIFIVGAAMLIGAHERSQSASAAPGSGSTAQAAKTSSASRNLAADPIESSGGTHESTAKTHTTTAPPVTITGCLERSDEAFKLKDTTGADAPKSRSWKSGFLKKGNAAVTVIDSSNRWKLENHIGQRVAITGSLVDREMQVKSLQRVANSCSAS